MTITIDISEKAETALKQRAVQMGKDYSDFIEYLVEREARDPDPSFEEIVAPIHKEFTKSGMTEEELEKFIDSLLQEVRAEKPLHLR